jgi:hypothetical protein
MIQPERRLGTDDQHTQLVQETGLKQFSPSDYYHVFPVNCGDNLDSFIAQSWIPDPSIPWNDFRDSQHQWNATSAPSGDLSVHQEILYPNPAESFTLNSTYDYEAASKNTGSAGYQPCIRPINQIAQGYGDDFPSQSPQISNNNEPYSMNRILPPNDAAYSHLQRYSEDLNLEASHPGWIPFTGETSRNAPVNTPPIPDVNVSNGSSTALALDWSTSEQPPETFMNAKNPSPHVAVSKRKYASPRPVSKKVLPDCPLEECVGVFENAPGALATVKKRKKLDAPVRKAARDVRKAGACHQCRFRKRTVSRPVPLWRC